jgi:hypothetical protein
MQRIQQKRFLTLAKLFTAKTITSEKRTIAVATRHYSACPLLKALFILFYLISLQA